LLKPPGNGTINILTVMENKNYIGIDFGGTNIKIGCFAADLRLLWKTSIPTDAHMGPAIVIDRMVEAIKETAGKNNTPFETIKAIGFSR